MSDAILLPAPECQTSERDDQWERERLAFLNHEPALLLTHRGKFVARAGDTRSENRAQVGQVQLIEAEGLNAVTWGRHSSPTKEEASSE